MKSVTRDVMSSNFVFDIFMKKKVISFIFIIPFFCMMEYFYGQYIICSKTLDFVFLLSNENFILPITELRQYHFIEEIYFDNLATLR